MILVAFARLPIVFIKGVDGAPIHQFFEQT